MEFFNPRDKRYKSINKALNPGVPVTFRVCMPRHYRCESATFIYHMDFEDCRYVNMEWDGMCGEDYEWWRCTFTPEKTGLYWYHFEYTAPYVRGALTKRNDGVAAALGWEGEDWQITVFEKDFKTPEFLNGGIIYQIFPDRFNIHGKVLNPYPERRVRSDYENDPEWKPVDGKYNNDYFGGNLQGIKDKLVYLASLGVSCIYLNPIFEAHSNHRYDTADYMKIDGMLGSEKDFKELTSAAKELGISVILDGVFSHVGQDSVYFNMYKRYPEDGAYNSRESKYFPWFKFNNWPDDYKSWWNIRLLPEINEDDEGYLDFICGENGVAKKWLSLGASGWRLDVADELPDVFLDKFRQAVKEQNENAFILGEVWEDATNKISYSERRRYLTGRQLDSVMNYPFANGIINFVRNGGTEEFANTVLTVTENYPAPALHTLMNHIGTHDTPRAITALAGEDCTGKDRAWQSEQTLSPEEYERGKKLLKIASLLQYTLPGVPSLYYGDEAGMQGYSDPFNRRFYPWGKEDKELLAWYKALGALRRACPVFKDGEFEYIWSPEGSFCFVRTNESGKVLIAVNRGSEAAEIFVPEPFSGIKASIGTSPDGNKLFLLPFGFSVIEI